MKLTDVRGNAIRGKRMCAAVLIVLMGVTAVWGGEYVLYFRGSSSFQQITAKSAGTLYMSGNNIYTPEEYIEILIEIQDSSNGSTGTQSITVQHRGGSVSPWESQKGRYVYRLDTGTLYSISFRCQYTYKTQAEREKPSQTITVVTGEGHVTLNVIEDTAGPITTFSE